MNNPHYSDEQSYWDNRGDQPYSVLSDYDRKRLASWIDWKGQGAVLDIGGGSGEAAGLLGDRSQAWNICLDISFEMVRHAQGTRVQGDALKIPLADNSISLVIAAAFFHHVPGLEETVLRECFRVLVPGGRIVGYDPNALCFQNRLFMQGGPSRLKLFSPDERPIDPNTFGPVTTRVGFTSFRFRSFSFRYPTLTGFEVVQRYLLNPMAKGRLRPFLDRWFFWEATKPRQTGQREKN